MPTHNPARRLIPAPSLLLAASMVAAQSPVPVPLEAKPLFEAEICQVDGLTAAQCDCAYRFVAGKLAAADLRLAMLLTAAGSDNRERASAASRELEKAAVPERRRDDLQSSINALTVEAEDRCSR